MVESFAPSQPKPSVTRWRSGVTAPICIVSPGHRDHGDAGLLHVGTRYYAPQVGRFLSRDAVLSEHPYLYCEHEPVMRVDPAGNLDQWVHGLGAALAIGGGLVAGLGSAPAVVIGGSIVGAVGGIIWAYDDLAALWDKIEEWWHDLGDWLYEHAPPSPPSEYLMPMPA
ncbi:MAG: RHS repeat-associated core domain-containing protein [Armatimonadota bacterium]|nr:RHS repeat-associated core domain-containing protein [Armatimonadota bacterium]